MSARNGDKSRHHRERRAKQARRERVRALRKKLAATPAPAAMVEPKG